YDGEIRSWDGELPALLGGLERLGVRDSTVIVVIADHGEEFQEHGLLLHRAHLYDELLHVPLVIAGPGIHPGRRTDQVQGIDLFPTLAQLLGFASPPDLPGRSVLADGPERPAFCETDGLANNGTRVDLVAMRRPGWKLILAPASQSTELYDLGADPGEHAPLPADAGEGPALRRTLDDFVRTAPPAPVHTGRDPALLEKLRAVGYANGPAHDHPVGAGLDGWAAEPRRSGARARRGGGAGDRRGNGAGLAAREWRPRASAGRLLPHAREAAHEAWRA